MFNSTKFTVRWKGPDTIHKVEPQGHFPAEPDTLPSVWGPVTLFPYLLFCLGLRQRVDIGFDHLDSNMPFHWAEAMLFGRNTD